MTYRIVVYSDGEVIRDVEVRGYILLTKGAEGEDETEPSWHESRRGLNDMEDLGFTKWAYDLAIDRAHVGDETSEGPP